MIAFINASSSRRVSLVLWLIQRWCPRYKLALVLKAPDPAGED